METNVKTLEGNRVEITVTIEAKEINDRIAKQYRTFARQYNFPGFRKGKAPRPVIDSLLGPEAARAAVTDDLVNDTFPMALDDTGLSTVGQPEFGQIDLVEAGKDYSYTLTIGVVPTYELNSYDNVEIKMPEEGATDAEIDDQLEVTTAFYVTYENARANTKVKKDSYVDLTISAKDMQGEAVEAVAMTEQRYRMGGGQLPEEFDAEVLGMKKGETKEFNLVIPVDKPGSLAADLAGKELTFSVECGAVKKEVKPEVTDEWVKTTFGFDTVEDLRKRLGESIAEQKAQVLPRLREDQCLSALAERLEGEPTDAMVEDTESNLLSEFFTQLQRQGMTFDGYLAQQGIDADKFKEDVKAQAKQMTAENLALDAWARHFEIVATEEEVMDEFRGAGVEDPKAAYEEWRKNGRLYLIREGIVRQKAADAVMENAIVTPLED
ncbi:MAG: trigger factor [Coriobacteriia bacterium]|nr:trigger factor [Coriobacteriia bacterium]